MFVDDFPLRAPKWVIWDNLRATYPLGFVSSFAIPKEREPCRIACFDATF